MRGVVEDVGDEREDDSAEAALDQFLLDLEELHFGLLDEQQRLGLNAAIWRQSSLPMLPPAPVTMTTRPRRRWRMLSVSSSRARGPAGPEFPRSGVD